MASPPVDAVVTPFRRALSAFEATVGAPCCPGALLAGLGVGLLLGGLTDAFAGLFGETASHRVLVPGALVCLAVGPLIPLRVAALLRLSRPLLRGTARGDVPLMWTALAAFALLAGLASALMPLWLPVLQRGGAWCLGRFLWTPRVLAMVQLVVVMVCLAPVATPLGVALSCLHRLAAPGRGWNVAPLGWALVGAGLGTIFSGAMVGAGGPAGVVALAAAVPMLLLAVLAAHRAGHGPTSDSGATTTPDLPDLRDDSPTFIRLVAAWLTAATAMVVVVWPEVWSQCFGPAMSGRGFNSALMIAMAGVGLVVCERSKRSRSPSIGGLGLACVLSGVGVAAAAALPACWSSAGSAGPGLDWVPAAAGSAAAVLMGYTAGYGQLAVLCRVGSRAASGAALLCVSLAVGAVVLLAVPLAVPRSTGQPGTGFAQLAGVALSLVAVGGTAIIHEPTYSARRRRWRLAAVAACVGLMVYGLPIAGRHWARRVGVWSDHPAAPPAQVITQR